MFKTIVVGSDGSKEAENALRVACDIAKKYKSKLHLVHTPQPQTVAFATGAVAGYHAVATMPSPAEVKKAADKIIKSGLAVAKECGQPIADTHTRQGDPVQEIISCAQDNAADLIITGRRGLGNLGALFLGSTSHGVARDAQCAVLSVA